MPRQCLTLSLSDANDMVRAAEAAAVDLSLLYCIAVVDAGGHLLAFSRQDEALTGCIDLAINKARTARLLDKSAVELQQMAQPGADLYGIQQSNRGEVVIIGGGLPVLWDGAVIGAIGASAGTAAQDITVAEAAIAALKVVTERSPDVIA